MSPARTVTHELPDREKRLAMRLETPFQCGENRLLMVLGKDEIEQVLITASSGLDSEHLGYRCSVCRFKLDIMFLNPGRVE